MDGKTTALRQLALPPTALLRCHSRLTLRYLHVTNISASRCTMSESCCRNMWWTCATWMDIELEWDTWWWIMLMSKLLTSEWWSLNDAVKNALTCWILIETALLLLNDIWKSNETCCCCWKVNETYIEQNSCCCRWFLKYSDDAADDNLNNTSAVAAESERTPRRIRTWTMKQNNVACCRNLL